MAIKKGYPHMGVSCFGDPQDPPQKRMVSFWFPFKPGASPNESRATQVEETWKKAGPDPPGNWLEVGKATGPFGVPETEGPSAFPALSHTGSIDPE